MSIVERVEALYANLITGDIGPVFSAFADKATVDTPLGGKQLPPEWVASERSWLAVHSARSEPLGTIVTPTRVAHELTLWLTVNDTECEVPVLLIADVAKDSIRDLRVYHSTWPLYGRHMLRGPLCEPRSGDRPAEPVASYLAALAAGDVDAIEALFEPDGYVREPAGSAYLHQGAAREEFYGPLRGAGGIPLKVVSVTDDGTSVVVEYVCDEWAGTRLDPQAGAAVWERSPSGKIAGERIYDDVAPPAGLFG